MGASRVSPTPIVEPDMLTGARLVVVPARDRYGVERVLGSYEDLSVTWRSKRVHNSLDNSLHERWNLAATAAGKHVLSEKPFRKRSRSQRSAGRRQTRRRQGRPWLPSSLPPCHEETPRTGRLRGTRRDAACGNPGDDSAPATRRPPVVSATRGRSAHGPGLLQPPCHPGHAPPWQEGISRSSTPGEANGPACPEWTNGLTLIWSIPRSVRDRVAASLSPSGGCGRRYRAATGPVQCRISFPL
jgi:hypothetical protein